MRHALRTSLLLLALAPIAACATVRTEPPTPPEPAGPPRGAALQRAVVGTWHGTADDGTDTSEEVRLTLGADGAYALSAGLVDSSQRWSVEGGLVFLAPDPDDDGAQGGICFHATVVDANRLVGMWSWGNSPTECQTTEYSVTLDRESDADGA